MRAEPFYCSMFFSEPFFTASPGTQTLQQLIFELNFQIRRVQVGSIAGSKSLSILSNRRNALIRAP